MATKSNTPVVSVPPENLATGTPPAQLSQGAKKEAPNYGTFPATKEDEERIRNYNYYERLFMGEHFEAFNIKIQDPEFSRAYHKLRYIVANFAGLISKVLADMMFSEPIKIKVPDGDQEFVDALVRENNLHAQFYESELANSYFGDDLFKLRVGPRHPENPDEPSTVIIEETTPLIYFPKIDPFNTKGDPAVKELCWTFKSGDETYLRKEIHSYGQIENKVFLMDGKEIKQEVGLEILQIPGLLPFEYVDIDECLLVHIPNWKTSNRYFGLSDYFDLHTLFFATNNRITAIDNILDKHSDPILMVPPGILDKNGKVKKKALGVIEYEEGESGEPKYIVWDASLENAFKEIDKLVELMFMMSETSPDILGMGQGQSDSGRSLKLKLLRTIAKARRKRIYYDHAIKQIIYRAQLLAKAYGVKAGDKPLLKEPVYPEIEWQDGLPVDDLEAAQVEEIRLSSGTTTKKEAIMRLDSVDEDVAEEKVKEIDQETAISMPAMNLGKFPGTDPKTLPPMDSNMGKTSPKPAGK